MFKFLIIGNFVVGKMLFFFCYVDDLFILVFVLMVGIDFKVKMVFWNDK